MDMLRCDVGEDDAGSHVVACPFACCLQEVRLSRSREAQQPENGLWHSLENSQPQAVQAGLALVELIEVGEDDVVVWQGWEEL